MSIAIYPTVFFRRMGVAVLLLVLLVSGWQTSLAQDAPDGALADGGGTAYLTGWPDDLEQVLEQQDDDAARLLPSIDTLALDYQYTAGPDVATMAFELSWQPGVVGVYRSGIRAYRELPPDVQMASIELRADVRVNGKTVAETAIAVDSMALRPAPNVYTFDVPGINYADVFLNTPAHEARATFERGFTLANLRIERIGFTSEALATVDEDDEDEHKKPRVRRPRTAPSRPVSIFQPRIGIFITGRAGGYDRPRVGREEPRGDTVGRTGERGDRSGENTRRGGTDADEGPSADRSGDAPDTSTERAGRDDPPRRTAGTRGGSDDDSGSRDDGRSQGKGGKDNKDDDDEDEDSLIPAAAGAAVAVAAVGVIGGTVGYYGTTDTPLGLTAGYVKPGGGMLLQAAINDRVIDNASQQRLTGKLTGFYGPNAFPLQPSLGLGVVAYTEGEETRLDPSVSLGVVANTGPVLIFGGYDVVQQAGEFGFAINFRAFGRSEPKNPPVAER